MVAYSFKPRFVPKIEAGEKSQTIRGHRLRHARPGEPVQLYTGMRTKACRRIGETPCLEVIPVILGFHRQFGPLNFIVGGQHLGTDGMEDFARADGFGETGFAVLEMTEFFLAEYPPPSGDLLDFRGWLIRWQPLRPTPSPDSTPMVGARAT